ncbi:MAG: hypothetical protein P4M00_11370 [Azospirillaceae bacterium]|nr:hypothetical protein [Azospirillaceae bacterium]
MEPTGEDSEGRDAALRHAPLRNDRLIAVFLLGLVAFSPPLLRVFGIAATVFGWPLLPVYVVAAWLGLILLVGVIVERRPGAPGADTLPRTPP